MAFNIQEIIDSISLRNWKNPSNTNTYTLFTDGRKIIISSGCENTPDFMGYPGSSIQMYYITLKDGRKTLGTWKNTQVRGLQTLYELVQEHFEKEQRSKKAHFL
jgi:hypothetical protein